MSSMSLIFLWPEWFQELSPSNIELVNEPSLFPFHLAITILTLLVIYYKCLNNAGQEWPRILRNGHEVNEKSSRRL